jgi:Bacterial PH domain
MARIETQDSDRAIRASVEAELAGGEHLIWFDQPRPWAVARQNLPKALFGIPFTAFAVFWMWGASHATSKAGDGVALLFPLWGLMFVGAGLWILCSPLWSAFKARSTVYAITGERLLIVEGLRTRQVTSYTADDLQAIERTERRDGSGDVVFRHESAMTRRGFASFTYSFNAATRIGFFGVSDVRRVEASIRRLAQGVKKENA